MSIERASAFFVTGGTLRPDAPSYVEREADRELFEGLLQGEFCYVLTSRQMGKSSLMVRVANRLRERGVNVAVLDLTAIGQNVTPEQWYDALAARLGQQWRMEDELEAFWKEHSRLSPVQRLFSAIRSVALAGRAGPFVVFVDESDTVRGLPFSADEFFAAIRECYNRRAEDPEFDRLTFCLLGVAAPSDLIRDTRMTPFNIGRRIELNDFTPAEAAPLADGLPAGKREHAKPRDGACAVIERVLHWTNGHPYLTQRFCRAIVESTIEDPRDIDRLCAEFFLSVKGKERDDNLVFVRERLLNNEADRSALLDLYNRVRRRRRVADDETNPLVSLLKLSGVARGNAGGLQIRNRIYERVFDRDWILANLPEAERRRQRAAFRRGAVGASVAVVLLLAALSVPLFTASAPTAVSVADSKTNVVLPVPARQTNPVILLSLEGQAEVCRAGGGAWDPAYTNQVLFPGDCVRTLAESRLLVRLPDSTMLRVNERSTVTIPSDAKRSGLELIRGTLKFFHRKATNIMIHTPHSRATIRG